jgi:hypothetical protein
VRSPPVSNKTETPVAVACWIGDDGEPIRPPQPSESDATEALSDIGHWLAHQIDVAREVTAASGPRLGPDVDQTIRTGSSEEVVAPALIRPHVAMTALRRGEVFDDQVSGMRIQRDSLETNGASCTWRATLRTGLFRERKATLRVGPSPSGNMTVLQLVPRSPRRFRTRSFVEAGVPAIQELSEQLSRCRGFVQG